MKKNNLCYGCCVEISPKHTARLCTSRRTCKVCQGKHLTGLHGCKTKNKISLYEAKVDNKNEIAMKSNCASIGNAATNLAEVKICVLCQCNLDIETQTKKCQHLPY